MNSSDLLSADSQATGVNIPNAPSFLCIGHRGAKAYAPENTLLSFEKAIGMGCHMVEFDVQLHGQTLLVFHDLRLERTTNGVGTLRERDLDYLRQLDAGEGERIPTLDETLDLIAGRVAVNIEMKSTRGTALAVAVAIQRALEQGPWRADQFLVSSYKLGELRRFHKTMPEIRIGALIRGAPEELCAAATELGAWSAHLEVGHAKPAMIEDARRRGLKIFLHTVNSREDIEHWRDTGIDGVFTDYPDRAIFAGAGE